MKRNIKGGLYLVVDPVIELNELLPRMEKAIQGGIDVIQVWNNWRKGQDKAQIVEAICTIVHRHDIPVIINEEWELMLSTPVDGVHFDAIPTDLNTIRQKIGRAFLCGLTCGNDLSRVQWAEENRMTYISFCSLFPSPSAGVCEIVKKETVQQARQLTALPIFLAGGITLYNVEELTDIGMNGIALISAIIKADDPQLATEAFKNKLKKQS
ncbi:MAG: thiamine phosphate synthase [Flavisolibacter sp.]